MQDDDVNGFIVDHGYRRPSRILIAGLVDIMITSLPSHSIRRQAPQRMVERQGEQEGMGLISLRDHIN